MKADETCPNPYTCLNSMQMSTAYGRGDEVAVIIFLEQNVLGRYTFGHIWIYSNNSWQQEE